MARTLTVALSNQESHLGRAAENMVCPASLDMVFHLKPMDYRQYLPMALEHLFLLMPGVLYPEMALEAFLTHRKICMDGR